MLLSCICICIECPVCPLFVSLGLATDNISVVLSQDPFRLLPVMMLILQCTASTSVGQLQRIILMDSSRPLQCSFTSSSIRLTEFLVLLALHLMYWKRALQILLSE